MAALKLDFLGISRSSWRLTLCSVPLEWFWRQVCLLFCINQNDKNFPYITLGIHPAQLKDDVQSPAGSSVYAMHKLESSGFKVYLKKQAQPNIY